MNKLIFFSLLFFIVEDAKTIHAIEPDEILNNKKSEKRARDISKKLRCLVCQNEDINHSNADIARDLRLLIREKITLGESDKQIINYVHEKYGDFILYKPKFALNTVFLWLSPLVLFCVLLMMLFKRKR